MPETVPTRRRSAFIFLLVWLASSVYLGMNLNKGWVPHDEGTLGESAERVLHGEMPHLDFDDPYTGGLAYVDAAIFKLFGINLFRLRLFLFVCFVAWVPAVYAVAREFLSPWPAAGITLVAIAWSVPNYPAAMPSWFNLFFATFGTLALARYIRKPVIHWLVLAGLCGGFSFLIKSVALYYVAAALLFFVYREQSLSRNGTMAPCRTPFFLAFLILCLSIFTIALIKLVLPIGGAPEYLHFVLPGFTIVVVVAARERTAALVSSLARFTILLRMGVPFLVSALLPVSVFFLLYWRQGSLAPLAAGLFASPFRRFTDAYQEPPGILFEYPAVLAGLFIVELARLHDKMRLVLSVFLLLLVSLVLITAPFLSFSMITALQSGLGIVPVIALAAIPVLAHGPKAGDPRSATDQQTALLVMMTVLFSLIQFPFSAPVYFCYTAPLAALSAAALLSRLRRPPRLALGGAITFYILFALLDLHPAIVRAMNRRYDPRGELVSLPFARAGNLLVFQNAALQYEMLIPLIQAQANRQSILAGPDCPEVYFLSGLRNPTPILFDFLRNADEYKRTMQTTLDRPGFIKVVVINERPEFSGQQLKILHGLVDTRFPESRKIGLFTVYWRP
jgi:hypothetical protein